MWPSLFQSGSLVVPTYLVIDSLAFCLGIFWVFTRAEKNNLDQNATLDICIAIMIGAFIGSRGFHVFFEKPDFYLEHPMFIFKFWYGGFVYYGGFFVGLLFGYLLCLKRKYNFYAYADLFAPVVAGAYALGRLGCLAAGCCYGIGTNLPWGIIFPEGVEAPAGVKLHPTQIYFFIWEAILCCIILLFQKRQVFKSGKGQYFGLWLLLHAIGRGVIEQFRGDFRGQAILNLSVSTWLSAGAVLLALYLLLEKNASTTS